MLTQPIRKAAAAALFITATLTASAVPAKPGLLKMAQPDGTELNVRLMGDEFHHFYVSEDGYYLVEQDHTFYYANVDAQGLPVSSGIKATPIAARPAEAKAYLQTVDMTRVYSTMELAAQARTTRMGQTARIAKPAFAADGMMHAAGGPGLFPDANFPVMGEQKGLVILVNYTDVQMQVENPHDYFSRMLNEEGFSSHGGTGSARDFYTLCSMGQFVPEFDVYGPVTLPNNRAYYGGNGWSGDDQRPAHMVVDACNLLDGEIDFSQYDRNGDGVVDNIFVFYAGRGEASGGGADTVWPHAWNVEYGYGYSPTYDGVSISRYACSNEWEGSRPDGVGTFVHEFSHVMGLPDLYATQYTSAFTPGSWSCMDYGPYNNGGCTPPLYGAFERYALGWMEPMPIDSPINATLEPIIGNKAGIINTSKRDEYFLVENRQQESWDTYIPGHGMLVWHIDYNGSVWDSNRVNNTPSHQYVDIEEADGTQSSYSQSGDAFPGTSHITEFTDDGNPNMKTWSGQKLNTPLTEIAENQGIITFKAKGGRTTPMEAPVALEGEPVDDTAFIAKWEALNGASGYTLTVFTKAADSEERQYLPELENKNVGTVTEYTVTGLEAGTEYFYAVRMSNGWEQSEESNVISVFTGDAPLNKLEPVATEATGVEGTSFIATWEKLDKANAYILNVYTKEFTGSFHGTADFSGNLPEGWKSTSSATYANSAYSGQAVPGLRMGRSCDYVESCEYADGIKTVTFWHRGNGTSEGDIIRVHAKDANGWSAIKDIPVVKEKGGEVNTVEAPEGVIAVRIEFIRNSAKGSLALDDVDVAHGTTFENIDVEGYEAKEVGDVSEYEVTGLKGQTKYYYTVKATDGTLVSKPSNEIEVETKSSETAISDINAADSAAPVEYYNLQGIKVTNPQNGVFIRKQGTKVSKVAM